MLKIQKVILSNFCQHEYLELELSSGLIGIFGNNGVGKSSTANAICGAFTGDFSRHSEGAAGCIRQNQPNDAYVEVHGTIAEQSFRLRRDITRRGVKHSLWLDGAKHRTHDKARDIESWLNDVSGLTPQIMAEFLFIGQQDLYGFLETTDANRSKKFSALCGTRNYEHRRDAYNDFLKQDKAKTEAASSLSVDFLKSAIQDALTNLKDVDAAIEDCREKVNRPGASLDVLEQRVQQITDDLRTLEAEESLVSKYVHDIDALARERLQNDKDLKKAIGDYNEARQGHHDARGVLAGAEEHLKYILAGGNYQDVLVDLQKTQKQYARYAQLMQQLSLAKESLEDLVEPEQVDESRIVQLKETLGDLEKKEAVIGSRMDTLKQLIRVIDQWNGLTDQEDELSDRGNDHQCFLCGADAKYWKADSASLQSRLDNLQREWNQCRSEGKEYRNELHTLVQKRVTWQKYQQERETLLFQIRSIHEQGEEISSQPDFDWDRDIDADIDELLAAKKRRDECDHQVQVLQERFDRVEEKVDTLTETAKNLDRKQVQLQKELAELNGDPAERATLLSKYRKIQAGTREQIASLRDLESQLHVLQGSQQTIEKQLSHLRAQLEEQKSLQESQSGLQDWFEKFGKAVNWFKKDGLPRVIHRSVLDQLVTTINRELSCFDSPFEVTVNDDLTFTATFPDGVVSVAKDLSGGQKVMLALAFWSAINCTFARNLGIMILDEPTDGLDQTNKQHLYRIMEEWSKLLRRRDQQVIIITHDIEMEDFFDNVFVLDNNIQEGLLATT